MERHIQAILDIHGPKGLFKGDELLLPLDAAPAFLDDLHRSGVVLLGIDYWYTHHGMVAQDLSSADFSAFYDRDDAVDCTYHTALKFIQVCPKNIDFVSFVF
jgi:hypothetical protein